MVTLQCGDMQIAVKEQGAELCSVFYHDREWIWDGDPAIWERHAPILFPFCGALKNDEYIFNGVTYPLRKHGFARETLFTLELRTGNSLTFLMKDLPEYKAEYPFSFELRATFTVNENRLTVAYTVKNTGDTPMPYAIGAHEGYDCRDGGVGAYEIVLDQEETLNDSPIIGDFAAEAVTVQEQATVWSLADAFSVEKRMYSFAHLKNRAVTLRHRASGRSVRLDFETENLLMWTKSPEHFICLEPWSNFPPPLDSGTADITTLPGVTLLSPGETNTQRHTITFDA